MNVIYPNIIILAHLKCVLKSYVKYFFMQSKFQLEPKQRFNMCGHVGEAGHAYE